MSDLASLVVKIKADISELETGLDTADEKVKGFGKKGGKGGTGMFARMGQGAANLRAGIGMVGDAIGMVSDGFNTFMAFDDSLSEIQARAGLTAAELENVRAFALQMGADTRFSGQEAANAMLELLSSGMSVNEAMMTLPAIMAGATANATDLYETADYATNILSMFGLGVDSTSTVIDSLTQAAGASSASFVDLAQGFGNVGPLAASFGLSVDDTAAILAVFSDNGIKGAEAGTQLKSMLTNMQRPTEDVADAWASLNTSLYDAEGNARPLNTVIDDMQKGLSDMTPEMQNKTIMALAGSYGQMGLQALLAAGGFDTMGAKMDEAAGASEISDQKADDFSTTIDELNGSIETLKIEVFGDLAAAAQPAIEGVIGFINGLIDAWNAFGDALPFVQLAFDEVMRGIQSGLNDTILTLRTQIQGLSVIAGTEDDTFKFIEATNAQAFGRDIGDGINQAMIDAMNSGDLSQLGQVQVGAVDAITGKTMSGSFEHIMLNYDDIGIDLPDALGVEGKMRVEQVLEKAFSIEDQQTIDLLTPAAVELGIDMEKLKADVEAEIAKLDAKATVNAQVTVNAAVSVIPSQAIGTYTPAPFTPGVFKGSVGAKAHATGLNYVPYDGYAAMLHRGESVLSRGEADRYRKGGAPTVVIRAGAVVSERQLYDMVRRAQQAAGR